MIFGFHLFVCLVLLVLHTTAISPWIPPGLRYDPLIPFVVFLGLHRRPAEGLPAMLAAGFLADGLSAAPFGLFGIVYLLLLLAVWRGAGFFRSDNRLLPSMGVVAGVSLEHLVFLVLSGSFGAAGSASRHLAFLTLRLAAAALTGPAIVAVLRFAGEIWDERIAAALEKRDSRI